MSEVVKTRAVTALLYGQNARVDYESAVQKKQTKKKNNNKKKQTKQKAIPRRPPPPFQNKKNILLGSLPVAVSIQLATYSLPQPKQ